jgi:hypothetical protein
MKRIMKNQVRLDFAKIEWNMVDREKAEFFFKEAIEFNNKVIGDINTLNNKGFAILAISIPVLCAAADLLLLIFS